MKKTVTYTGFATNGSTGRRERVEGRRTFDDTYICPQRAHDVAVTDLQLRGYTNVYIDDTRVTG